MTQSADPSSLIHELQRRADADRLRLPVLPEVATEVLATVQSDDCDARCLANIVQRDPSIAAGVLRIANSARYAPTEPIVSLMQAISRLGLSTLRDIVMAISVEGAVFSVHGHEAYVAAAWRHSHASGQLAQEIARLRRSKVEAAYLCGLLHDIGAPLVLQGLVEICEERKSALTKPLIEAAVEALHAKLGAQLIASWGLPAWTYESALFHHDPAAAKDHGELVHTVALADALSHWILDDACEGLPPGLEHAEALDLYEDDLAEIQDKTSQLLAA